MSNDTPRLPFEVDYSDYYGDDEPELWEVPDLDSHPVADLFPMMDAMAFGELLQDIAQHGVREPIWTLNNTIIDGRNRYKACKELGLRPPIREYTGADDTASLVAFVLSLNLKRRHLTSSQRAVLALEVEKMLAVEAKERQGTRNDIVQKFEQSAAGRASEQAAAITGTNRQYVSDAKKIAEKAPELLNEIRSGAKTITEAKRELKEQEREQKREVNRELVAAAPIPATATAGQRFQTIVIDPPWDWGDEGDADQFGRARPTYNTMPFEDILALPIGDLAATNAHIYLWITNRSLPKGFQLLDAWGFRYITCITWCKPSIGMGNYFRGSTEQLLFGVRGSLPLLRRDVGTWFEAPRGSKHSSKPTAFYELVERCSPGPWLEMFARSVRNGWSSWGAEACTTLE